MKASKPVTKSKTGRASGTVKVKKIKKDSILGQEPNEEEIRSLAEEIYIKRLELGEDGNATDDWLKAEDLLKHPKA